MEWLEPWYPADENNASFRTALVNQLYIEVGPDHELFGIPVKLIARGEGDDALFEMLDGTGRVAVVHLTWSQFQQRTPWPCTIIYASLVAFAEDQMRADRAHP